MREAIVATLWFTLVGVVCAIIIWPLELPPDVKGVCYILLWCVNGGLPPAFYKLMRQWFG